MNVKYYRVIFMFSDNYGDYWKAVNLQSSFGDYSLYTQHVNCVD